MNPRQPAYDKVPNPAEEQATNPFVRFAVETHIFFAP